MSPPAPQLYQSGLPKEFSRDPCAVLPELVETTPTEFERMYLRLSKSFSNGKTKPLEYRKQQLFALYGGIIKESHLIVEAIARDFKTVDDAIVELNTVLQEITGFIENLDTWTASIEVSKPLALKSDSAKIIKEPFGMLLTISPWNFPFLLAMDPFLGAIGSGNCCVLKPSEMSPNSSAIVTYVVEKYLDPDCYAVANGGKEITTIILQKKWDFIAYTGNGTIARVVTAAAAKNLTPTLLELGGKSPAIIDDETCDLRISARRILWAKCVNAGQICITADYIICRPHIKDELVKIMKEELYNFFANETKKNSTWPRIVNQRHCERIVNLIPKANSPSGHGTVVHGGKYDIKERYIEPTIITDIDPEVSPLMKEEIFGPLIPIIVSENIDDTIQLIKSRDKPLALYIFSDNSKLINRLTTEISSGGVCINDTLMHFNINTLPFGGVGESGMGSYHAHHSIDQFSHKRAVYTANNYRKVEAIMTTRYPGQPNNKLVPILFPHNLYPSLPNDGLMPKIYNHTVSTIRWLGHIVDLLTGGYSIKRQD